MPPFRDRVDAGRQLAKALAVYADRPDLLILALPRGGVPVGFEIARALRAPLEVFMVRKLGLPGHEEYAMGAVASGGVTVLDDAVVRRFGIPPRVVEDVIDRERMELRRREELYRGGEPPPAVTGKTVILVDDGLATGSTMRAAVTALRKERAKRVVVAVPIGAYDTCEMLRDVADSVVCAQTPEPFYAVGLWYDDFEQTTDEEVRDLLERAARAARAPQSDATRTRDRDQSADERPQ
jgi:putative phosphoribosyl transferase